MNKLAMALVLSASLSVGGVVSAQTPDADAVGLAQQLFDQAKAEMAAKNFESACPKLETARSKVPDAMGIAMTLGECYEGAGKLSSAFSTYVIAEGVGRKSGKDDRADAAKKKADELKNRFATVTFQATEAVAKAPGLVVRRGPRDITDFGLPLGTDRGEWTITVMANGHRPWTKTLTVADGDRLTVELELGAADASSNGTGTSAGGKGPTADPGAGSNGSAAGPGAGAGAGAGAPATGGESNFWSPLRIVGLSAAIGGVGLVGGGIGAGVVAKARYDDSNTTGGCSEVTHLCETQKGVDMRASARSLGVVGTVLTVTGAVVGAGGIVLFAVAPSDEAPSAAPSTPSAFLQDFQVGVGPGFVSASASF